MNDHDNCTKAGQRGMSFAGPGVPMTRDCMPGAHRVLQTKGSGLIRWRGVPGVWACAACKAKHEAKAAAKAAAKAVGVVA